MRRAVSTDRWGPRLQSRERQKSWKKS
jgi:hypothetical protein